jgi:hypothetical protein
VRAREKRADRVRVEGSLRVGPELRNDDEALRPMTLQERIAYIERHARIYGSFGGAHDFVAQFRAMVKKIKAARGDLANEFAHNLTRATDSIESRLALDKPEVDEGLYLGIVAGFLFANLTRELERDLDGGASKLTVSRYRTTLSAHADSPRMVLANACGFKSVQGLTKWEKGRGLFKSRRPRRRDAL